MKKKLIISIILTLFFVISPVSFARDELAPEPTDEAVEESDETDGIKNKINDLKERLATKVAELRKQNKRSFYGVIKDLGDTSMILLYRDEEIPVAFDDDTTYFEINAKNARSKGDKDSYELGETALVFGTLDLDDKTIVAGYLYTQQLPLINHGVVSEIDENDGSFTIDSSTGSITLDYEISTQCTVLKDDVKTRCGLSQINPGDRVFLRINPDEDDIARATVKRILHVPQE